MIWIFTAVYSFFSYFNYETVFGTFAEYFKIQVSGNLRIATYVNYIIQNLTVVSFLYYTLRSRQDFSDFQANTVKRPIL